MSKFIHKSSKKAGLPPGTLIHVGQETTAAVEITVYDYNKNQCDTYSAESITELKKLSETDTVSWINIDGVHNIEVLKQIGKSFGIHSLVLEDILNTGQRPKLENHGNYLFIVLKMLTKNEQSATFDKENISLILTRGVLISFQEKKGDVFNTLRQRILDEESRIRSSDVDYLAYRIIDTIVDNYFIVLEHFADAVEAIETELTTDFEQSVLQKIHTLKKELMLFRKPVWPLREVIGNLLREESPLIADTTRLFLRDAYDHTIQVVDSLENLRELTSSMQDLYLSLVSNKMNEIMKVLTIIATIFIPLTFIAGVYGMNFENMPELKWPFGYGMVWLIMLAVGVLLGVYFKRKKWF